ncbi:FixW_protein [Hexamita inflata]|uniref:Putative n=1 Tax=Hexamita inflata TaxID=28002 RepID=A0AA86QI10_9EUKA|nr:FixW protein [Hexamita inflata]
MNLQEKFFSKFTPVTKVNDFQPGMPAMLECFATWCPPCRGAIPHLAEMAKNTPEVYIVSVSREEESVVAALKAKMPLMAKYNLAVDSTGTLNEFMEQQGVDGIPHAFLFDKTGALVWQGHPMDGECADKLKELAGKK